MQIAFKHKVRSARKHPVQKNYSYRPYVSILIPAHNEAGVIADTLENISKIDYTNYEIIVIENNSKQKETFDYYESLKDNNAKC